ncbi:hypothetical protein HGA92_04360 [Candidatus Gracilibacteria bacterium]|nr:hypothetical protein [Candidatus Gracilibacteria bacterium]NUJ98532.1 hypothetical protein [Candidatus Gracilibacteria bacterium]
MNQNIDFNMYVGKINILDLYEIHEVQPINENAEKIDTENPKDFLNNGLIAQRKENAIRISDISKYVSNGVVPNSIILGNEKGEKGIIFEEQDNGFYKLIIKNSLNEKEKLFVIDGQHRLKGAALNLYNQILKKLIIKYDNNSEELKELLIIEKVKKYFEKIEKIKFFIEKNNLNDVFKEVNIIEFSVVILDNISNDKIVEIFTDINSSQKPLDSNIYRYYYGRFTTKYPYFNISVNIAKLLNEHKDSPLFSLIKMPYDVDFYKENLKGYSRVGVGAFCERFNGVSEINNINIGIEKIDFYKKPLGIFINYNLIKGNDKIVISEDSIINSIKFLFSFMIYSYKEIYELYISLLKDIGIGIKNEEFKNYKFIDSTTNELYFDIIRLLLIFLIVDLNYNIENILKLSKDDLKKSINTNFDKIKNGLIYIYKENKYFKRGEIVGTGWAKSTKIIKEFEKKVEIINEKSFILEFNNSIINYLKKD